MKEKIEKDRQLLLIFSLSWVALTLWALRRYPDLGSFDFSTLPSDELGVLFLVSFMCLVSFILTTVYVYKMYAWSKSTKVSPRMMTGLFIIASLVLGVGAFAIVMIIFWKSRILLMDKKEEYK